MKVVGTYLIWVGIVLGAFVAGAALGASGGSETPVEKSVTPQVCKDAIKAADELVGLGSEGFTIAGDTIDTLANEALVAAATWDVAGLESATETLEKNNEKLDALTDKINQNTYHEIKGECS